jgi:hypothetical protein
MGNTGAGCARAARGFLSRKAKIQSARYRRPRFRCTEFVASRGSVGSLGFQERKPFRVHHKIRGRHFPKSPDYEPHYGWR